MKIPLPKLMRHWREREFERHLTPATVRANLALWGVFRPPAGAYRLATRPSRRVTLGWLGRRRGRFASLPLAGGWTGGRDMPAPEGETFFARYAEVQRQRAAAGRHERAHGGARGDPPRRCGGASYRRIRRQCCAGAWLHIRAS